MMPMDFFHHTFSDVYASQNNWLTRIDVRVKLFYIISLLAINLWAKNIFIPSLFLSISFIVLFSIRIPLFAILRSMLIPISFAILILIIKGLHEGEKEWLSLSIVGCKMTFREEGLRSGLHTCSKVLGGISLVITFYHNNKSAVRRSKVVSRTKHHGRTPGIDVSVYFPAFR